MTSRPLIRCIGSLCGSPDCPRCYPGCDREVTCPKCGEVVYMCYTRWDDGLCEECEEKENDGEEKEE